MRHHLKFLVLLGGAIVLALAIGGCGENNAAPNTDTKSGAGIAPPPAGYQAVPTAPPSYNNQTHSQPSSGGKGYPGSGGSGATK